ncbi:hopene-associated glycosyltransferase HpnB [Gloeothece citriformis PCC 7424]|uniref:Hopene-associated glycosyltransferase HpnB n=1 Tax=Gloeothece citriformis (strain PCC 7424) TaxID=65393 RepID=B7KB96_GLOC7|nr:glycosyltransferase [Gloeothece citriformis]ACK71452.1 hopene-associated glycosyltransferase HpnB [Gloeothece citriformis PCC 7424]
MLNQIFLGLVILSLFIWLYLLTFRGKFWLADQRLNLDPLDLTAYPSVCAIVPARNEAEMLPTTLKSLLDQNYRGEFSIILIDDQSSDGTGKIAEAIAKTSNLSDRLTVISGEPLPGGWTGKLWAMEQGIRQAQNLSSPPKYLLLTDADIVHDQSNLQQLVIKAEQENLALVSLMVLLRCKSFWEKVLIPAFVFFFQKLYPFPWVNNQNHKMAAAAGGCILIRRDILENIGGIEILKKALIDDCSLAAAVKAYLQNQPDLKVKSIWLGLTESTYSLRPYPSLKSIWDLVARTAFTQLNYSPGLLLGTIIAMSIIYLVPPISLIVGFLIGNWLMVGLGGIVWLLMAIAYFPTLKLYQSSFLQGLSLPAIAFLYTLMTIDSALRHWRGQGGGWKGRVYQQ